MALRKVLLAYDGSRDNGSDLEWGLNFVKQAAIGTVIVKVFGPPSVSDDERGDGETEGSGKSPWRHFKATLDKILNVFADRELSTTTTVLAGDPDAELMSYVEREQVDMVICGSKGVGFSTSLEGCRHGGDEKAKSMPLHTVYSFRAVRAS